MPQVAPECTAIGCPRTLWLGLSFRRVASMDFLSQDHMRLGIKMMLTVILGTHNDSSYPAQVEFRSLGYCGSNPSTWVRAVCVDPCVSACSSAFPLQCCLWLTSPKDCGGSSKCPISCAFPTVGIQGGLFTPFPGSGTTCQAFLWG